MCDVRNASVADRRSFTTGGRPGAIWLFTIYDEDELADLTARPRKKLKVMIKTEWDARKNDEEVQQR
jgi:hypothetical protein